MIDRYVRCKYCDSSIPLESLEIKGDIKKSDATHDSIEFTCVVCNGHNPKGFIFKYD